MRLRLPAAAAVFLVLAVRAIAGPAIADIPEIGPHYRIATFEKNIHPQNLLVAYTRLDGECRVLRDPKRRDRPALGFYWLMDGSRYKRVNPLIERGIRKRLRIEASPPKSLDRSFSVSLSDLNEVEQDIGPMPLFWVRAKKTPEGCVEETLITLGPSDKNAVIQLDSIYSEAELTGGFGAKVKSVALKGVDEETGKPVVRVYRGKPAGAP